MSVKILIGDALARLGELEDQSVHCVVTSPPYWGLRDYGTAKWEGGDNGCNHSGMIVRSSLPGTKKQASNMGANDVRSGDCVCGARRIDMQLGLEATPEEHCSAMVEVFREVKRVLRDDGTLWLNYGDCYAGGAGGRGDGHRNLGRGCLGKKHDGKRIARGLGGLRPKALVGMPWRVAFALQADGWYLRSDIIWHKPNPMPESVTDRPTKSHEYVFLMAKSAKYFYDADAVRDAAKYGRSGGDAGFRSHNYEHGRARTNEPEVKGGASIPGVGGDRNLRDVWKIPAEEWAQFLKWKEEHGGGLPDTWTIATHAYSAAHFATFPPKLVEPCIKAGCPEDGKVLDPFGGAGTVGLVADRLGRDAILIELNEEYARMARKRIYDDCPMFTQAEVVGGNGL